MLPKFRKSRTSIIFRAEGYCKHSSCILKIIRAKLTEDLIVSIEFEGTTIRHKVGETQARPIQGIERQKYKVSVLNPPLKKYCQRIKYIPDEMFAAGNRDNSGTSRDVWKQIRYEKEKKHRLDITELDSKIQHRQQQANRKSQRLHTTYISCYVISLDTSVSQNFSRYERTRSNILGRDQSRC